MTYDGAQGAAEQRRWRGDGGPLRAPHVREGDGGSVAGAALRAGLGTAATSGLVRQLGEVVDGVVEDGDPGAALAPLSGRRRRWPWAVGAALAGAAAGGAVSYALRRLLGEDAPEAQEPEQLVAVVDTGLPPA